MQTSSNLLTLDKGIPEKGKLLTNISLFWFKKLAHIIPNHFVTANIDEMPEEVRQYKDQLDGRAMLVKKAEVIPLEAIVRGYLAGSAWSEYKKSGTVHGIPLPEGLVEGQKLPQALFTPSTKAEQGSHDENISPEQAANLIGQELYDKVSEASLKLYTTAADYAYSRGVIFSGHKIRIWACTIFDGNLQDTHFDRRTFDTRLFSLLAIVRVYPWRGAAQL